MNTINEQFSQIRNAIVHIEDYKTNSFMLYNVHIETGNVLMPPFFEYKNNNNVGNGYVLEYMQVVYNNLLNISKQFLSTLV